MRILVLVCALLAAGASATAALAGKSEEQGGILVLKDMRTYGVTELRDAKSGKVISSTIEVGESEALDVKGAKGAKSKEKKTKAACEDKRHKFIGPRWRDGFEPYFVNGGSLVGIPASGDPTDPPLDPNAVRAALMAGHDAWPSYRTDCDNAPPLSSYQAIFGGDTVFPASLADGVTTDGYNVVEFRSLAGTICDGAVACTIIDFQGSRIREVDMIYESYLTRYGFDDYWTTSSTTVIGPTSGLFAIIDASTHEFGHFAGLGHVFKSPSLTMFPGADDGQETLGSGDMDGLWILYK